MLFETVGLKLELLSNGVNFSKEFLDYFQNQSTHIEKDEHMVQVTV